MIETEAIEHELLITGPEHHLNELLAAGDASWPDGLREAAQAGDSHRVYRYRLRVLFTCPGCLPQLLTLSNRWPVLAMELNYSNEVGGIDGNAIIIGGRIVHACHTEASTAALQAIDN